MDQALRLSFVALYGVGPVVAVQAWLRRPLAGSKQLRVQGWRWHVPTVLLPFEWLLPPALIFVGLGAIEIKSLAVPLAGLAVSAGGAAVLLWASAALGRFLIHGAAVAEDHSLVTSGPYRFVRHPVYVGYLALLLGSALGAFNIYLLLLWFVSLAGISIQTTSEELLLEATHGGAFQAYANRTGRFLPRWRDRAG
jgi:protein-S-isoprenylcysteine O-methyltransferase Ste14